MADAPDTLPSAEKIADILERVKQFNLMKLPSQMQMMHMGTSYLVNDLTRAVKAYATAIPEREREIKRLRGSNKQLADIVTDQEDRRLKAEARVTELEAAIENCSGSCNAALATATTTEGK